MQRGIALIVASAAVLTACGLLQPTPARHRPPLPVPQQVPDVAVEDVVPELEGFGFDCSFSPERDQPSGWFCRRGDQDSGDFSDISLRSEETGPIHSVFSYVTLDWNTNVAAEPELLDREGLATFEHLVSQIIPENLRPSADELLAGVKRNFPMELGGGWYLGFDRNSSSRSLNIVYAMP